MAGGGSVIAKHELRCLLFLCMPCVWAQSSHAILAGGEFDLPADTPSRRIDTLGPASPFNFVGALELTVGAQAYKGSASALSPHWALTAGHNVDFNDDGHADDGLFVTLHLPGLGSFAATSVVVHPHFKGFGSPSVHNDLSLLYFATALPDGLSYPSLGLSLGLEEIVTLVGFGRSGYGSYGYTTSASLTDRRAGFNTVDSLDAESGGSGLLFRYDFDPPASTEQPGGSLGNALETIIGPGDSGGPCLIPYDESYALVGVNTFTEGYGGRFGDTGGGVVLNPDWAWISGVTGLPVIPEPGTSLLLMLGTMVMMLTRCMDDHRRMRVDVSRCPRV